MLAFITCQIRIQGLVQLSGRCVFWHDGELHNLVAVFGDFPQISVFGNIISIKCLDIPVCPFKYWKWHKGKKHRHHRLSLLPRGLLATRPVVIFNVVLRTPLKYGVVGFCALLQIAAGGGKSP